MARTALEFAELDPTDRRGPGEVLVAFGRALDIYTVVDVAYLIFGLDAYGPAGEILRGSIRPGTPLYRVTFPNGSERTYATMANARRAIRRHYNH